MKSLFEEIKTSLKEAIEMEKNVNKIIIEVVEQPNKFVNNQKDRIIRQTFTCCGKQLEKFLREGWDYLNGDIIPRDVLKEFKFCPFCSKEINSEYEYR